MEPSWQLYGIASVGGALAGSSAFALTSRRGREPQARTLSGRVGAVTQ
jgi:hypothetical protein